MPSLHKRGWSISLTTYLRTSRQKATGPESREGCDGFSSTDTN